MSLFLKIKMMLISHANSLEILDSHIKTVLAIAPSFVLQYENLCIPLEFHIAITVSYCS